MHISIFVGVYILKLDFLFKFLSDFVCQTIKVTRAFARLDMYVFSYYYVQFDTPIDH